MDLSNIILLATEAAIEHATEDAGFIGTLGLNWKLFLAQLVNFAIVLFVLWKWVFRPVAGALEARREKIEKSVKQAEDIEKRMIAFEKEHEENLRKSRVEAEGIIKKAEAQATESKTEIVASAHREAEKMIADAKVTLEGQKKKLIAEIKEEVADLVALGTEKILREKLDSKKDREIIDNVIKEIK